jgi:hypothetical protein
MFDEIQEKRQKQHPFRNASSKYKYVESALISRVELKNSTMQAAAGYSIFLSCIEIHNDKVYDLFYYLNRNTRGGATTSDQVKEELDTRGANGRFCDLSELERTQIEVSSTREAMELILEANSKRAGYFAENRFNFTRSHFIVNVTLVKIECRGADSQQTTQWGINGFKVNQLCIVDLVGCDKLKPTVGNIELRSDNAYINASLLALRTCLEKVKYNSLYPAYGNVIQFNSFFDFYNTCFDY